MDIRLCYYRSYALANRLGIDLDRYRCFISEAKHEFYIDVGVMPMNGFINRELHNSGRNYEETIFLIYPQPAAGQCGVGADTDPFKRL